MHRRKGVPNSDKRRVLLSCSLPALVLLFSIFFVVYTNSSSFSTEPNQPLDPKWYTPKTARGEILKNKTLVGNCFICHSTLIPGPGVVQPKFGHKKIDLKHGLNDRCYNCHYILDRNKFTPDHGPGIVHANIEKLCARCHGLIYNDWLSGTHGIWRGKWSAQTEFEREIFDCTQCHDPHSPRFQFTEYAPPPIWSDKFIRRGIK